MHVIGHQVSIQNLTLPLQDQRVEDFSRMSARLPEQHLAPSLGDEHHMVFAIPS